MKLLWFTVISVFCITNGTATDTISTKTTKSTSTSTTPTPPQGTSTTQSTLHFSCQKNKESGKVNIKLENLGAFGGTHNVSVTTNGSTCKLDSSTLKDCTLDKEIEIKIVHNGKEPRMVRKKDVSRFSLSCSQSTDAAYQLSVQTNIDIEGQLGTVTSLEKQTIPPTDHLKSEDFTMSITPNNTVTLGTNLEVTITETKSNLAYMVQTCTAVDENDVSGYNTSLWSNCTSDNDVFTGKWQGKPEDKSKSHTLEAFIFNDNNRVNISCTLLVCPNKKECEKVCESTGSRRRRSASSSETRTVSASFSVKGDGTLESANAATGNRETLNTLMFVMLPSAIALRTIFART